MGDTLTLAGEVYGSQNVTRARAVSVRRALRALEARGEVEDMGRVMRYGRRLWASPQKAQEYRARVRQTFGPQEDRHRASGPG